MDSQEGDSRLQQARNIIRFKSNSTSFSYPNSHSDIPESMFLNLVSDFASELHRVLLRNADFWVPHWISEPTYLDTGLRYPFF